MKRCVVACGCLVGVLSFSAVGDDQPRSAAAFRAVTCEGIYPHHLQGIDADRKGSIYWSFTTTLVATDAAGRVLKAVPVKSHHGGLVHHDGKLYVAVNFGSFNNAQGRADNWIYVYDAKTLKLLGKHPAPQVKHGAGGIAFHDNRFIVIGGLPEGVQENYAYEYDTSFKFIRKHTIKSGYTNLGIQAAGFHDGHWWFGCYGNKLLKVDKSFKLVGKYDFNCGLGIAGIPGGRLLVARGSQIAGKGRGGSVLLAKPDDVKGLVILKK